ncbi:MAG: 50S ribosomal protein L15 [Candidatus Limnocylindrales bacterium]
MKLHDLRPAPGSVTERTRVGRGSAAGKGKTAGRGTKGQKSRAGGSIPAGFEGGQTPIHRRVPKLHGFKNPFRIAYEVVNIGRISEYAEQGRFAEAEAAMADAGLVVVGDKAAPLTVNAELLRATGLVGTLRQPVKILGSGEISRPLFIVADAFTRSAREKIEAAGGTAQLLEVPTRPMPAIGLDAEETEAVVKPVEAAETEAVVEAVEAAEAEATMVETEAPFVAADEAVVETVEARQAGAEDEAPAAEAEVVAEAPAKAPKKPARKRTKTESAE